MSNGKLKNYKLPEKKELKSASSLELTQEVRFQTHLLPPQLLREYNAIIPHFADDIHQEFIKETSHRRSNNNWLIKGAVISKFIGQFAALLIALAFGYWAWDLGKSGQPVLAGFIGGLDLVGLVSVFLGIQYFGNKNHEEEKAETEEEI